MGSLPASKRSRLPGTPATSVTVKRGDQQVEVRPAVSYRKPKCSKGHDPSRMVRVPEAPGWACLNCMDEWAADSPVFDRDRSVGGVELPTGIVDERKKFSVVMPNRRVRRRYR